MTFWKLTHKKWALSVALLLTVCALFFGCDGLGNDPAATLPSSETTAPIVGMHQLNILESGPLYMEVGDTITLTTDAPAALKGGLTETLLACRAEGLIIAEEGVQPISEEAEDE